MLLLDLQWLLFGLLLLLIGTAALAVWFDRRLRPRQSSLVWPTHRLGAGALDQAPFGVLLLDEHGIYRYTNRTARELLALDASESLPGAAWRSLLDEDRVAARTNPEGPGRYRRVTLQPELHVRWWVTPVGDLDLVLLEDATAPYRAEQAARLLISDLSHELRTPLATVLTHLEVLRLQGIPEETRQLSLHLMHIETQRMTRLVHNLLELGYLETSASLDFRPVDLLALVEGVIAQITPEAEARNIPLSLQAQAPLPSVMGDADRLRQLFLNLLENAVKYCCPGDQVVVALQPDAAGTAVACAVQDNGPGIPAEHLPHVTRRFYRAAPQEVAGSGLGLALAAEIVRRHGSRLEIESRSEGDQTGTRICFSLPTAGGGRWPPG